MQLRHLSGKVLREGTEMLLIFRVNGKYYPATDFNCEIMDTWLHTGNKKYLDNLENEMED